MEKAKPAKSRTTSGQAPKLSGPEEMAEFMKNTSHPLKPAIEELREIILSANKGITEHIKWNGPSFCFDGDDRVTFNLHKNDCIIIVFHRGAKVKDSKGNGRLINDTTGLLEWLSDDRAVVKMTSFQDVTEKKDRLQKVVKLWIKATSE